MLKIRISIHFHFKTNKGRIYSFKKCIFSPNDILYNVERFSTQYQLKLLQNFV